MYESLRFVYTTIPNYLIGGLAGRELRIERVSLAHDPSARPRKKRNSNFGLLWEMSKLSIFGETPLMYQKLRLV
jgi:hypothetical protein